MSFEPANGRAFEPEQGVIAQGGPIGPMMRLKRVMTDPSTDLGVAKETVIKVMLILLLEMDELMIA